MTTKLEAINRMFTNIGQAPVVSLDATNPEISLAATLLESVSQEVQGEGWHFNSEINYPFIADNDGIITIPPNVLQLSDNKTSTVQNYQTVARDGKLYDKLRHTFEFQAGEVVPCDVVWKFDFADLPQVFKDYIVHRATRLFAGSVVGSEALVKYTTVDEQALRASCIAYDTTTSEANVFGVETGQNFYVSYTPFRTIAR